jgi:hypothetical protein
MGQTNQEVTRAGAEILALWRTIVHFSGHGCRTEEEIILLDQNGLPKPVSKGALAQLFRTLRDNVRVVLLNACWTRPQAEAIA